MAPVRYDIDSDLDKLVGDLAKEQNVQKGEVVRRAIALMKLFQDQRQRGNKFVVTNGAGAEMSEIQ